MHLNLLTDTQVGAQKNADLMFSNLQPGQTFYVALGGNDSNPGSATQPWRTIKKAVTSLKQGQRAIIRAGTYREDDLNTVNPGTAANPIWLSEAPGESVVLEGAPNGTRPFFVIDQPYWVIDGFEIRARGQHGHALRIVSHHVMARNIEAHHGTGPAAVAFAGASDAALINSVIHDYTWGDRDSHGVAVTSGCRRILIQRNHSYRNSGDSVQCEDTDGNNPPSDIWILQNRFHGDRENAVDLKKCTNVTVRANKFFGYRPSPIPPPNASPQGAAVVLHLGTARVLLEQNRIWDCGMGASMGAGPQMGEIVFRRNLLFDMKRFTVTRTDGSTVTSPGHGVRTAQARVIEIYHNTLFNIAGYGIGLGDSGRLDRSTLVNNLAVDARIAVERVTNNTPGIISDWNLFWNSPPSAVRMRTNGTSQTLQEWRQSSALDPNSLEKDPMLVADPRMNDFFTRPGSPARDVAHRVDQLPFCGTGPDIGFLESCP